MNMTRLTPIDSREFYDHAGDAGTFAASMPVEPGAVRAEAQLGATTRLIASLDYMKAHLNKPINISALSAMAGFSKSTFFHLFKRTTGNTPLNWFIRARMQWAGELLERSDLQIKEIAWQLGYEDQFYFSRVFKSVHGIAPSDYRVQKKSQATQSEVARIMPALHPD